MPHAADIYAGKRLRMARKLRRVTQTELAAHVGLSFQQVQKYEKGANRMGASRLLQFARFLDVPISFFFEICVVRHPETLLPMDDDSLCLLTNYQAIGNKVARQLVFKMIMLLAKECER